MDYKMALAVITSLMLIIAFSAEIGWLCQC
jgi:hypothetical protein